MEAFAFVVVEKLEFGNLNVINIDIFALLVEQRIGVKENTKGCVLDSWHNFPFKENSHHHFLHETSLFQIFMIILILQKLISLDRFCLFSDETY